MTITAVELLLFFCVAFGGDCRYAPAAHVTTYAPDLGGINCQEPCNLTAWQEPLRYGIGAACGPNIPYGTVVHISEVGQRVCNDRGGAIDDYEVDILIRGSEHPSWMAGHRSVLWVFPRPFEP